MRSDSGDDGNVACVLGTDFDGMSHRQMLAMIEGVDQQQIISVASKLTTAGSDIHGIAKDLKTHMSNLEWDSASGDAFREWGHKVASATHTLSDYATTAGTQLHNAGQVLGEVHKDMPPVPEGAVSTAAAYRQHKGVYGPFGDDAEGAQVPAGAPTPTTAQYQNAVGDMKAAQTRAADNMTKLSGSYSAASEQMGSQKEPVFPALPTKVMPPDPGMSRGSSKVFVPGGGSTGGNGPGARLPGAGDPPPGGSDGPGEQTLTAVPQTHLDDFAGPYVTDTPLLTDPPSTLGTPPTTGPFAPAYPGMPGQRGGGPLPLPGRGRPGKSGGSGPGEQEDPLFGGAPGGPGGRGGQRLSTGIGDGIAGGRLTEMSPGGPGGRLRFSVGTVIGEEPGGVASGVAGAGTPFARPAGETGFERPGAAPYGEPGAGGTAQSGGMSRSTGGMPMSVGRSGAQGRRNGHRPDYLVEEEETWNAAADGTVPSVFE